MKQIHVLSVFGTRPEAIKMCPLVKEIGKHPGFVNKVCLTSQHSEMLRQVMDCFMIREDYDLKVMTKNQTVTAITTKVIRGLEKLFKEDRPDIVLVHGDTTTTFAAALAAFYAKIPVGHVEAGLRTYDKYAPYPEEMNRTLASRLADLHFAPTALNRDNLVKENVREGIYVTGNTVIDAFAYTVRPGYRFESETLRKIPFGKTRLVMMTAHRRENWGKPLENICEAVKKAVSDFKDISVVYPVHLNPAVRNTVFPILGNTERVILTDPVNVMDMHNILPKCHMVITDSGGLQEEAPYFGVPVLVFRGVTERVEAIEAGTAKIIGLEKDGIYGSIKSMLTDEEEYGRMARSVNPYGDGKASARIVAALNEYFGKVGR